MVQIQTVDNSDANPVTRFQINHSTGDVSIPSGDLDVTGTVTADGLTVDGSATIQASSSPALIVKDTTNNAEARLQAFNSTATVGTQSNHSFSIETNDTNRALFASNGDISFYEDTGTTAKFFWDASAESLGIGTINPTGDLEIATSATDTGVDLVLDGNKTSNGGVGSIIFNNNGDSVGMIRSNRASANDAADMLFYTQATGGANSERMRIASSGLVGIGATSPENPLHVNNTSVTSQILVQGDSNDASIKFNKSGQTFVVGIDATDNSFRIADNTALGTNDRITIDSSGNLLVGTTDTFVGDNATGGGISFASGGAASFARSAGTVMYVNRTGSSAGEAIEFRYNGGDVGNISVTASATAFNTSSDQRLKENIADADDAGSKVDAIQVRKFDWIADGSHQDYGMVAQELVTVAPEAVTGDADSDEMMGVDYSKLVPMLVKEIQSLRNRVAQLENN